VRITIEPAEIFKVLSVETRIQILGLLKSRGPLNGKNIAEVLGISPAAVSQHLKVLRQAGLVRNERKGYWIPYSINEEAMEECRRVLNEVCTCGCDGQINFEGNDLSKASMEHLRKYERELDNELRRVKEKIYEIKSREE
jgi:DNA-binding transcriptional ArsR family regulator